MNRKKSTAVRRLAVSFLILLLLAAGLLVLSGRHRPLLRSFRTSPAADDPVLAWLVAQQGDAALLGSDEATGNAYTYDQALAAIAFTEFGEDARARRILDFYAGKARGNFAGFNDFYPLDGHLEPDARAGGPNAWMLLAINFYTERTGDRSYLPLAHKIAEWLLTLQAREGGIAGGYGKWNEPMSWMATEHNLDAYAALRDFAVITRDDRFQRPAAEIRRWLLSEPYAAGLAHPLNGRQDPNYATDLSSWGVLALGPELSPTLAVAESVSLCTQWYRGNIAVTGFDFGGGYAGTTLPDKDAVWFEGTGQMACAYERTGNREQAVRFLAELDKALMPSPKHPNTKGLPYASNPGTPPYAGWVMPCENICVSSSAWYLFAKYHVNPFTPFESTEKSDRALAALAAQLPPVIAPPVLDDFQHLTSLTLGASYRALSAPGARDRMSIEKVRGEHYARFDFLPKGETGVYEAYLKRGGGPPRTLFRRTLAGSRVDLAGYRAVEVTLHADGSDNAWGLTLLTDSGEVELGRWTLERPGLWRVRAALPAGARLNGYGIFIEGMDLAGSTLMLREIRLLPQADSLTPSAASFPGRGWERLTGFESTKVLGGGSVAVYGAAETDWRAPGLKSWYVSPVDTEGYAQRWLHDGMQSFRILWRPISEKPWASFALNLGPFVGGATRPQPMDLGSFDKIVFWMRGERGGEVVKVGLRTSEAKEMQPNVLGPSFTLDPFWTRYEIDLKKLLRGTNAPVEAVVLDIPVKQQPQGVIYTDDWWLVK